MSSALLVMDVQQGIVDRYGGAGGLLDRLTRAVAAAREAGVPVMFVRIAFRPGFPEVSPANRTFRAITEAAGEAFTEGQPGNADPPRIGPGCRRAGRPQEARQRPSRAATSRCCCALVV